MYHLQDNVLSSSHALHFGQILKKLPITKRNTNFTKPWCQGGKLSLEKVPTPNRPVADMKFVKNFTPSDFQAKNFTPSISPNFNSFSDKNTKK